MSKKHKHSSAGAAMSGFAETRIVNEAPTEDELDQAEADEIVGAAIDYVDKIVENERAQQMVAAQIVRQNKPYSAKGSGVLDAVGQRVAIAGYDGNREASGPIYAQAIADALNRIN